MIASLWYLCTPESQPIVTKQTDLRFVNSCMSREHRPICQALKGGEPCRHLLFPGIWSNDFLQRFFSPSFPPGTLLGLNTMAANQIAGVLQIWSWIFTTLSIDGWFVDTVLWRKCCCRSSLCLHQLFRFFGSRASLGSATTSNITPKVESKMHFWWLEWTFEGIPRNLWWDNSLKFLISHHEVLRSSTKVNNEKLKN